MHACCSPYPAGTDGVLRCSHHRCCLHREMTGSAPRLFLCRGCRLHLMLRPTCLLPAERLSPLCGLLTPRSSVGISPNRMGPATRRSGAYRDGTLTRWRSAARFRPLGPLRGPSLLFVTAHHLGRIRENFHWLTPSRVGFSGGPVARSQKIEGPHELPSCKTSGFHVASALR